MAVLKTRWKSAPIVGKPKEEKKIPEKKIIIPVVEEQQESITPTVVEDPTAEEFIATLPKKQSRKKVTKIIEE
jgi:hypothetical protein